MTAIGRNGRLTIPQPARGLAPALLVVAGALLAGCDTAGPVPDDTNPALRVPTPPARQIAGNGAVDTRSALGFALTTTNGPGERRYSRLPILGGLRARRACAAYASPDAAQTAFLEAGGPERDPQGLDPDGDGFACDWSPEPYRRALGQ